MAYFPYVTLASGISINSRLFCCCFFQNGRLLLPYIFCQLHSKRPYNKKNITRQLKDMDFMFSWLEQYLTRSLRSLVRYCSCHSNIKSISSRNRVISSIYVILQYTHTQPTFTQAAFIYTQVSQCYCHEAPSVNLLKLPNKQLLFQRNTTTISLKIYLTFSLHKFSQKHVVITS